MKEERNAIRYILKKRNLKQSDLRYYGKKTKYEDRYVYKVTEGILKINKTLEKHWEDVLQIPSEYFMNEDRKCKVLDTMDFYKIDSYIHNQYFLENYEDIKEFNEAQTAVIRHQLEHNISILQRRIRADVLSVKNNDIISEFDVLAEQDCNLWFYRKIHEFRESQPISSNEWDNIFKAFYCILDNVPEQQVKENENPMVYGIYIVIKKSREIESLKNIKEYNVLKEIFGSLLDEQYEVYEG